MSCENCPEPTTGAPDAFTEYCFMPLGFDLAPMFAHVGVKADELIKDWVPCNWKIVMVKGDAVKVECVMRLDTSQCLTCPNRQA